MTLKELLEWAEKNDCLDYTLCVQYRDEGGMYEGEDFDILPDIDEIDGKKVIVL